MSRLAILCGRGPLPRSLAEQERAEGQNPFLIGFKGQTHPETLEGFSHQWLPLGAAGKLLRTLKKEQITDLTMIGALTRPSWTELKPDLMALRLLWKIGRDKLRGDNSVLSAVTDTFESHGIKVRGIHELMPDLLTPEGILGRHQPADSDWKDIELGSVIAETLGTLDVGQSVVVQDGIVLGVEAIEGTDALVRRCGDLKRKGKGGVLVKRCKPQQDRRVDLPTIGPTTLHNLKKAGLVGLAVEAQASLMVEQGEMIVYADANNLFIVGIRPGKVS